MRKDGETPLFDGLGSERTVTDAGGAVLATLTTTAFGQPVACSGSSASAYQFGAASGYRSDGDGASATPDGAGDGDSLLKVGCRYYDPATGGFLTRDTDLGQSPYAYCDADPVNRVDPSGHGSFLRWVGILFACGAFSVAIDALLVFHDVHQGYEIRDRLNSTSGQNPDTAYGSRPDEDPNNSNPGGPEHRSYRPVPGTAPGAPHDSPDDPDYNILH